MGNLASLNLQQYIDNFGTKIFFETGTHEGNGLKVAQGYPFEKILSVEIVKHQAEKMQWFFAQDTRISIFWNRSLNAFEQILPTIDGPILFWLDAHFPGADLGLAPYDVNAPNAIRLPLEEELRCIKRLRAGKKDVVLIDDLWIYRNNGRDLQRSELKPFEPFSSDRFFCEILAETHDSEIIERDEIYCILTPKA